MSVLIITRSDDNECVELVAAALRRRGHEAVRLDSDLYPQQLRLSTQYAGKALRRLLVTPRGRFDLSEVTATWYRRFFVGAHLPPELGDLREACLEEARRTLYGTIAALPGLQVDKLVDVRRADHKELQLLRASALGLRVPRTLFSNDPDEVRRFCRDEGPVVTKMQSSFAVYRGYDELVVFTTPVKQRDLADLEGLRYSPMQFQAKVDKQLEIRATVVGDQVLAASIDSQRRKKTAVDWRRDGMAMIDDWKPYRLPAKVERALRALTADFGLHYAAADFILTPAGEHVFLEINASGEWCWLQRSPGLPIAEAMADLLISNSRRKLVGTPANP